LKTATQLKAKSRNLSNETGIPVHIVQRNFLFERFLERASLSEHRNSFIIKGGMLIASMIGIDIRATVDLDATLRRRNVDENVTRQIVNDIISVSLDDATDFTLLGMEQTRVESDYPGWRITLNVAFDGIRDTLKLDITVGDEITPNAIEYNYKLMFEERRISLMAYNPETILAEKYVACVSLGIANSRMKDFYDVFILTKMYVKNLNHRDFSNAVIKTAIQRHTILADANLIIEEIAANSEMLRLWKRYQVDNSYAADIDFLDAVSSLKTLAGWNEQSE